jgi:hypothetical protein
MEPFPIPSYGKASFRCFNLYVHVELSFYSIKFVFDYNAYSFILALVLNEEYIIKLASLVACIAKEKGLDIATICDKALI